MLFEDKVKVFVYTTVFFCPFYKGNGDGELVEGGGGNFCDFLFAALEDGTLLK